MQKVIQWRLRELLKREGVTIMALAEAMPSHNENTAASRRTQLYTIASPDPMKRPKGTDFHVANGILEGMRKLKGREFTLAELLEYTPDATPEREA